jgi:uncharacterized protein Usg
MLPPAAGGAANRRGHGYSEERPEPGSGAKGCIRMSLVASRSELALQLKNYRLTTAHILYRMPDYPALLQEYVWQDLDLAPNFPVLNKFLRFWEDNLDGALFSVKVAHCDLIQPAEFRMRDGTFYIH